ncbi:MAG: glycosyltransferase family 4 protein, partial [Ghiorsea sp.]|nr:glycosyltransferase family 4 protein [Ghiorsea sp.]
MQILIVSQYFYPENFRINDLAMALKEKGHDVTVLTGMPNYPAGKVYEGYSWWAKRRDYMGGIPIVRVPLFARRESKSWQLALNYISFAISACVLGSWMLRKQTFDVVFTFEVSPVTVGIPANFIAKQKSAKHFFWVQDLWPETLSATGAIQSPKILSAVGRMVRWIYKQCDTILVQSKGFEKPAIAAGAAAEKIRYFPNWAESLYQPINLPKDAKERGEIPSSGFIVMFAGNLGAAQSLETIVGAAERLKDKDIHWVFLGDGRRRKWLEDEVQQKGLDKVHILGRRDMATMPAYFSLADAMLVTLRDDPVMATTIPGKVQSYLACGKPIVGALSGSGQAVIQESGAGFCVDSGDIEAFSDSV